jgi:serine phosphatase RsbU (regulator of sigma subunit)
MDVQLAQEHGRAAEAAALALHRPGLAPEVVTELLRGSVVELGLCAEAVFLPPNRMADPATTDWTDVAIPSPAGELLGILRCRAAPPARRRELELLAAHAGVALAAVARTVELERREDTMRRVAERLQDALLPKLPDVPQTMLAVRYRAAAREARVGGDFYDVFTLPDGRVLIVVGDVVGKGVEAAGRTSRITQTLRALALQGVALEDMLWAADSQVMWQDPEIMATVWCGLYEPATGEVEFASLGHPPALLLRSEQDAIRLELEGLPLGMRDLAPTPPETRNRKLEARDLLVLYTDGVVEASGDLLAGMDALLAAVASRRDEPLAVIVDEALDDLLTGAGHRDDAVLLLLRRR